MTTKIVVPTTLKTEKVDADNDAQRMQIAVHIQTDVIVATKAQKIANTWLLMNAGNLLRANNPELILDSPLKWRFDVWLTHPDLELPGTGSAERIGQAFVNAVTGEVLTSDVLIDELKATANAVALG